jgi:iron complex transport system substrate-binding protein
VAKRRIISLLPSCTEIVCALGLEDQLVGRSHECDFPPSVRRLPACTEAKLNPTGTSARIDRDVKTLLRDALSIYRIDAQKLRDLCPDVILTQAQCAVCAVSLSEVEQAVRDWTGRQPRLLSLSPIRLADLWTDITTVGEALGVAARGKDLVKQLKGRVADVIEKAVKVKRRPSVACIEWLDPLMAAGNWVPELVELAGGLNLFGDAGKHSPWLNWEAVQEHDPEVIVVMPCGFDLTRTRRELPALTGRPDWAKLRAVKKGRVFLTDGNQFFNRPGPRLVESLEILAEIFHPNLFHFGHEPNGWQRL